MLKRITDVLSSSKLTGITMLFGICYFFAGLILSGKGSSTVVSQISLWEGGRSADVLYILSATAAGKVFIFILTLNLGLRTVMSIIRTSSGKKNYFKELSVSETIEFIKSLPRWDTVELKADPVKTGFTHLNSKCDSYYKSNNLSRSLGGSIMKASLFLLLFAFMVSLYTRVSTMIFIGEGQSMILSSGERSPYSYNYENMKIDEALPVVTLDEVKVLHRRDMSSFHRKILQQSVSAELTPLNNPSLSEINVGSWPPRLFDGNFLQIIYFGLAPRISLVDKSGSRILDGFKILRILSEGGEDGFDIEGTPYRIDLMWYPEDGVDAEYIDLRNPVYSVKVRKQGVVIFDDKLEQHKKVNFENLEMLIPETRFWIGLGVMKDYGMYIFAIAFVLLPAGAVLAFVSWIFVRRFEVFVLKDGQSAFVGVDADMRRTSVLRAYTRMLDELERSG